MQAKIASVDPSAHCGWIVDLRKNPGGNVWPMLSGLGPILGEGELMSMKGPAASNIVVYARGRALDKRAIDQLPHRPSYAPAIAPAVAVLTSPMTASSGEGVTIAFRGRPHTRSFGAPTAGVSTGNAQFKLEDGALIFLTTSVMIDRNGKEYGEAVRPDVEVQGDAETQAAATQWLRNESGCSKRVFASPTRTRQRASHRTTFTANAA